MEESRIREARCNKKHKEIRMWIDRPSYLWRVHLDWIRDGIREINNDEMWKYEKSNKYWIEENCRIYVFFCRIGQDKIKHYVEECTEVRDWFRVLGSCREERK